MRTFSASDIFPQQQNLDWHSLLLGQEQNYAPSLSPLLLRLPVLNTEFLSELVPLPNPLPIALPSPSEHSVGEEQSRLHYSQLSIQQEKLKSMFQITANQQKNHDDRVLQTALAIGDIYARFRSIAIAGKLLSMLMSVGGTVFCLFICLFVCLFAA
jgi:hypothetical protein